MWTLVAMTISVSILFRLPELNYGPRQLKLELGVTAACLPKLHHGSPGVRLRTIGAPQAGLSSL
jgi:hypothetical protein